MKLLSWKPSTLGLTTVLLALCLTPLSAQEKDPLAEKTPTGMVYVPGGEFTRGTNKSEGLGPTTPRSHNDARPEAKVKLPPFYIDKTEVTNADYKKFCDAIRYPVPPHWLDGTIPKGEENFPVTHISWWEAGAYARWAGKRLPTETEWEKVARGTDGRVYPWGDKWEGNEKAVWGRNGPDAVGTKPAGASPYGALDMAGNVFEWTSSWYEAYPDAPHQFEDFGHNFKVVRGGGFDGYHSVAETFYRSVAYPSARSEWIGFRCAQDVK